MKHLPTSTYRIQFHKDFNLGSLLRELEYLHALGISHIYASPVFAARAESSHGYDVIDSHRLNPAIGSEEELVKLIRQMETLGMKWIQDIVPNHMAFDATNERLMDVLERGPASPWYAYFDVDWNHPARPGKLGIPVLGEDLQQCISKGEIGLQLTNDGISVKYFDHAYPLSLPAYEKMFGEEKWLKEFTELQTGPYTEWISAKRAIISVPEVRSQIEQAIDQHQAEIESILQLQYYELMNWKRSSFDMNYRRFFVVNELICLRMEESDVFEEYHSYILSLFNKGLIHGLRVDHIDGLYDPADYLERLRQRFGSSCYIIAEKILEAKEVMPTRWPVEGTSGYEFLSFVSQLFTDKGGARKLLNLYKRLVPELRDYKQLVLDNKRLMLSKYMGGEWDNLTRLFIQLGFQKDFSEQQIRDGIGELMLAMPVYRIYPDKMPLGDENRKVLQDTFDAIRLVTKDTPFMDYLRDQVLDSSDDRMLHFVRRLMQFTGPLTAKGVEDTTFYVYNPLISHDEVGDAPSTLGITIDQFHAAMIKRQRSTPYSLNATATHDTKRGEDSRLRLNILSELPDTWERHVTSWMETNKVWIRHENGKRIPSENDEYFIYQSLVGGYPETLAVDDIWMKRFEQYLTKALREAKVYSDWTDPDVDYEQGCIEFVRRILLPEHNFLDGFHPFLLLVLRYAHLNSLGQVLLKATAPGIPDIYQGTELWDLSFVDPDNRREVDFELRRELLAEIIRREGSPDFFEWMKAKRLLGVEKMFVIRSVLQFRKQHPELVLQGEYEPLTVSGRDTIVVAFARHYQKQWMVVAVPLAMARFRESVSPYADEPEEDRIVHLPDEAPRHWRNIFTNEQTTAENGILLFDAFHEFPLALFVSI